MLLAGTPLAARQTQHNLARCASDVTDNWMTRTRRGGWRVRNGPRRACAGRVVKRHFGHSSSPTSSLSTKKLSARSVASAAARLAGRGPFLTLRRCAGERDVSDELSLLAFVITSKSRGPANALTLSCKDRPPCRPQKSGAAAAATNTEVAGANCSRRDAGMQLGAAQGGSAAEPALGGFCQLVRVVSPPTSLRFWRRGDQLLHRFQNLRNIRRRKFRFG